MKCQNCGKNEATFYYKSNINGRVMESHLCPQCARQLGLVQDMRRPMMSSFWDDDDFCTVPSGCWSPCWAASAAAADGVPGIPWT